LQYSFDESYEKSVKVFELNGNGVENLREIPLTAGKKLIRLEADSPAMAVELLEKYPDALVEMTLRLTAPLTSGEAMELSKNKNLVSLLTEVRSESELAFESRKNLGNEKLFVEFYRSQYGVEPDDELKTLFLSVMSEIEHE
jgi:exonuclease SbcD